MGEIDLVIKVSFVCELSGKVVISFSERDNFILITA